jgi:hypothetical protein|tara:strand:+ start:252 stop:533 length:282 start_codon:yes stop_codon:yes gene_type:complete
MTKKLKTKEQVKIDEDLVDKAGEEMKNVLRSFYSEYADWDCCYSRIGVKYYEALEEAYRRVDSAIQQADKKYVGNGDEIDWETTTHVVCYRGK